MGLHLKIELTVSRGKSPVCTCSTRCDCRCLSLHPHSLHSCPTSTVQTAGSRVTCHCLSTCASEESSRSRPVRNDSSEPLYQSSLPIPSQGNSDSPQPRRRRGLLLIRRLLGLGRRRNVNVRKPFPWAELERVSTEIAFELSSEPRQVPEPTELETAMMMHELPNDPNHDTLYSMPEIERHRTMRRHRRHHRHRLARPFNDEYALSPIAKSRTNQTDMRASTSSRRRPSFVSPEGFPFLFPPTSQPQHLRTDIADQGCSPSHRPPITQASSTTGSATPMAFGRHIHDHGNGDENERRPYYRWQRLRSLGPDDRTRALGNDISSPGYISTSIDDSSFNTDYNSSQGRIQYATVDSLPEETIASSAHEVQGSHRRMFPVPKTNSSEGSPVAAFTSLIQQLPGEKNGVAASTQNSQYYEPIDFGFFLIGPSMDDDGQLVVPPCYSLDRLFTHEEAQDMLTQRHRLKSRSERTRARHTTLACGMADCDTATLACGMADCDTVFRGPYRKGNRKRHIKNIHPVAPVIPLNCRYPGCEASYRRSDARRKHEWMSHAMGRVERMS